jgi:D-alanyl-D-alanine carboxypeptidase
MPDANAPAFSIVREPQCSRRHEVGTYTLVRSRSANRSQLLLALSFAALAAAELSNATVAALDGYVRQRFAEESVPGGALSVYVPGNGSLVRTWGIEDVKSNRTFDVRNHVRIASITKSVVGTAILQLVDQGALRLNDTLASLVPIEVPHASAITVEHMLSMTSGLFDYIRDAEFGSAFIADPKTPLSFDTFAAILRRNAPYFEPGMTKAANYCNSNFVLLGEIVARVCVLLYDRIR